MSIVVPARIIFCQFLPVNISSEEKLWDWLAILSSLSSKSPNVYVCFENLIVLINKWKENEFLSVTYLIFEPASKYRRFINAVSKDRATAPFNYRESNLSLLSKYDYFSIYHFCSIIRASIREWMWVWFFKHLRLLAFIHSLDINCTWTNEENVSLRWFVPLKHSHLLKFY